MEQNEILVTVICTVYNHEQYLRKCLDGFIMQKTTFPFEVIVHDDASTDGSADIIREYAEKYPNLIRPIYQTVNQYSQHVLIVNTFILPIARGKYVAYCEGDDYWCDENKLQMQYEAMENNPDCHFCVHKVRNISESGEPLGSTIPNFYVPSGVMDNETFLSYVLEGNPFQTSSYFRRTEDARTYAAHIPEFARAADVGDVPMMLYSASLGDVVYIDKVCSCYRNQSLGSWSMRMGMDKERKIKHEKTMMEVYRLFDEYTHHQYAQQVKHGIAKVEMDINCLSMERSAYARLLLKKENRWMLKRYNRNGKIALFLRGYAPWALRFLQKN